MDSLSSNNSSLQGYQDIAAKQSKVSFGEAASRIVVNDGKIEGQSFLGRVWASLTKSSDTIKKENVAAKDHFINAIKSTYGEPVADKVQQSLVEVGEKRALTSSDIKNGLKLAGLLKGSGADKEASSAKLTSKEVKIKKLNEVSWERIPTTIKKDGDGGSGLKEDYESTIAPASNLGCLKESYKADGIKGVCSKDERNASHTINGAVDKLEVKVDGGKTKQILQFVRSGVLTSAKIKDEGERTFAANNRFDENLLMALDAKGLLPESGEAAKVTRENPVELSIADIGLLSKNVIKGKEENMQDDQFKFLEGANNQPREISYTDEAGQKKTIWVRPKILAFNFGVQVSDRIQGQSKLTKQNNEASLDTLLGTAGDKDAGGMVKDFLESAEGGKLSDNDKKAITELAQQCREMRANGEMYSYNDGDIYAFPTRLTVLCDKIGIMPMIHCKSGKDRTSRLAEEAKFLAAEIHENTLGDDEGNQRLSERATIAFVSPKASGRASPSGVPDIQDDNFEDPGIAMRESSITKTGDSYDYEQIMSERGAYVRVNDEEAEMERPSSQQDKAIESFVPQKGRITGEVRTKAFIAFSSHSGNAEIQERNTGKPGNMQSWSYLQRMRSNVSDHMTVLPVVGKYFRDDIAQAYAGKSESVET